MNSDTIKDCRIREDQSKWDVGGLHKESGETFYYTCERRFVLRTVKDEVGYRPVWVFESMRPGIIAPVTQSC